MASLGSGPVLTHSTHKQSRAFRSDVRDEADQALWNLFTNSSLRANASIRSVHHSHATIRYARDRIKLEDNQGSIWIKLLPTIHAVLNYSDHHHTTIEAALHLLNNMIQPLCSTADSILKAAVLIGFVPTLITLVSQRTESSSKTMENGCNALRRIASVPSYRKIMAESIPALLKIVQVRSNALVVDAALSSLQNLTVKESFAIQIIAKNGIEIILDVLLDASNNVEAACNTLANIAAHPKLRRKVCYGTDTLEILLKLIGSKKLNPWMALKACFALNNIVYGETASCKECSAMGGALAVQTLKARLRPRTDFGRSETNTLLHTRANDIKSIQSLHQISKKEKGKALVQARKKPKEPEWLEPLLLRLKQSGRAMRRAFIVSNTLSEEARLGWPSSENVDPGATSRTFVRALEATGFATMSTTNASRKQFMTLFQEFLATIRKGDVVMFVFVGQGVSVRSSNYILPSDFPVLGRKSDMVRHAVSVEEIAKAVTSKVGINGIFVGCLEASPTVNGGGERFEPMVPMDCVRVSEHDNVCYMLCTTPPIGAADGSSFQPTKHLPKDVRNQCELDHRQITAHTYELALALVVPDLEASAIPKHLRQLLSDQALPGGRLPWCNSSMIDDFYFNEIITNEKGETTRRSKGRKPRKKINVNARNRLNSISSSMNRESRRQSPRRPPPPPRPQNGFISPRSSSINIKNYKLKTFGGVEEETGYSVNRESRYSGMQGTSNAVNMTQFVEASGAHLSGADVAGAARWTSQLRSPVISRPGSRVVQKNKKSCQEEHAWIISQFGTMQCSGCGVYENLSESQSVFGSSRNE